MTLPLQFSEFTIVCTKPRSGHLNKEAIRVIYTKTSCDTVPLRVNSSPDSQQQQPDLVEPMVGGAGRVEHLGGEGLAGVLDQELLLPPAGPGQVDGVPVPAGGPPPTPSTPTPSCTIDKLYTQMGKVFCLP